MKKTLHQIALSFDNPAETESPVPAESIPLSNTAPTPPLIIEIIDDEEHAPAAAAVEPIPALSAEPEAEIPETTPQPEVVAFEPDPLFDDLVIAAEPANQNPPVAEEQPLPKRISSTRGRKSLKETAIAADLIQIPEDDILFSKQYYSIGEVATMFRENQSLIRYWETEFDILQPRKNKKGDRFFRPIDIKNLVLIYDLLRRRKFTIEGAKDFLKRNKRADDKFATIQSLEKLKLFLLELRSNL